MGFAFAFIVLGVLVLSDRLNMSYGLREGWPWVVLALGLGGLYKNSKGVPAWITTLIGLFILGQRYYSVHIRIPGAIKAYILPAILIGLGILWLWKGRKS